VIRPSEATVANGAADAPGCKSLSDVLTAALAAVSDEGMAARAVVDPTQPSFPPDDETLVFEPMPVLTAEMCDALDRSEYLDMWDAYEAATESAIVLPKLRAITRRYATAQRRRHVTRLTAMRLGVLLARRARVSGRARSRRSSGAAGHRRRRARSPGRRQHGADDPEPVGRRASRGGDR
jgi:hypothetical protein